MFGEHERNNVPEVQTSTTRATSRVQKERLLVLESIQDYVQVSMRKKNTPPEHMMRGFSGKRLQTRHNIRSHLFATEFF